MAEEGGRPPPTGPSASSSSSDSSSTSSIRPSSRGPSSAATASSSESDRERGVVEGRVEERRGGRTFARFDERSTVSALWGEWEEGEEEWPMSPPLLRFFVRSV